MPQSLFSRFDSTPISQYCNCNAITHFVILSLISGFWHSAEAQEIRFQKHVLTQEFYAEGAAASDFDGDGVGDVVAGPWIYWGPSYQEKTAIYEPKAYSVNG